MPVSKVIDFTSVRTFAFLLLLAIPAALAPRAAAQGGPPYYTNDPGTPGNLNWEINLGYMPFFYSNQSVSHVPDLDINFGVGDRIQLTYENAWLRVQNPFSGTRFGLGQSNPGVKWRFYDAGESGLNVSVFPQLFLNNPERRRPPRDHPVEPSLPFARRILQEIWARSMWIMKLAISLCTMDRTDGSLALSSATSSPRNSKSTWSSTRKALSIPQRYQPTIDFGGAIKFIVQ